MKEVKIIKGTYGHKVNGRVKPVSLGGTVELQDAEADRLVALKVAEYVSVVPECEQEETKQEEAVSENKERGAYHLDRSQLEIMSVANLKCLATDFGIDVKNLKKAEIIDLLVDVAVDIDINAATKEPPADFPELNAEAPE